MCVTLDPARAIPLFVFVLFVLVIILAALFERFRK